MCQNKKKTEKSRVLSLLLEAIALYRVFLWLSAEKHHFTTAIGGKKIFTTAIGGKKIFTTAIGGKSDFYHCYRRKRRFSPLLSAEKLYFTTENVKL
jgi:hypothetical protein